MGTAGRGPKRSPHVLAHRTAFAGFTHRAASPSLGSKNVYRIQVALSTSGCSAWTPPARGGLIVVGGLWKRNSRSVPEGKSRPRGSEVPLVRAGRASLGGCDIAIAAAKGDSAPPVRSKTKNNLGDRRSCAWPWRSCKAPEAHAPTISRTAR